MPVPYKAWLEKDLEAVFRYLSMAENNAAELSDEGMRIDLSEMKQHVLAMQENLLADRKARQRYTSTRRQSANK